MRKTVSTLLGLALVLAFGCDVEEAPPEDREVECIMEWTDAPCQDALDAAEAAGCQHYTVEKLGSAEEAEAAQTECVLAVAHLRGLADHTQLVLDAWREPGGAAHDECVAMGGEGFAAACQLRADLTGADECLGSDELRLADLSGEVVEGVCQVLVGECEWVQWTASNTGQTGMALECE